MYWLNHQELCSDSSNQIQDMAGSYCRMKEDRLTIQIVAALLSMYKYPVHHLILEMCILLHNTNKIHPLEMAT